MGQTNLVPGDPSHYDSVTAFPSVAACAGPSAMFLASTSRYVREDGTIDLKAKYIDSDSSAVRYTFVEPDPTSDDADVPIGARAPERLQLHLVYVTIRRSQFVDEGNTVNYHGGMQRTTGILSDLWMLDIPKQLDPRKRFDGPTPPPRCHFGVLWAMARQRGAPAGAVAVINYERTGYRFRIDGTPFKLAFDTSCNPKE